MHTSKAAKCLGKIFEAENLYTHCTMQFWPPSISVVFIGFYVVVFGKLYVVCFFFRVLCFLSRVNEDIELRILVVSIERLVRPKQKKNIKQ